MSSVFRKPPDNERNVHATLYIGNLDPQVTEVLLYELLIQFAPVKTLNFPKDRILKTHQGYGFVEFRNVQDAEYILEVTRGVRLFGKPIRVKRTDQGGTINSGSTLGTTNKANNNNNNNVNGKKNNGVNNNNNNSNSNVNNVNNESRNEEMDVGAKLFIKNLNPLVDEQFLKDTFSAFGHLITPPIIVRDENGNSKRYGFITFGDFKESDLVIEKMHGKMLMNTKISVEYAFKDDGKVRHGDEVERTLASKFNR